MEVKVSRLRETLSVLAPIPPKKPILPVMNYILFADGKAATTDLVNTVMLDFPEADEAILVPRDTLEWLRFIPGDRMAAISIPEDDPYHIVIACGSSQRTWPSVKSGEYPSLRQPADTQIRLDGDIVLDALQQAVPYVCQDENRSAVLGGVTVIMDETGIMVGSGDGFRMFVQKIKSNPLDPTTIVIPTSTVKVLRALWRNESRPDNPAVDALLAEVALSKRLMNIGFEIVGDRNPQTYMSTTFGGITVITHLITGTPPDWKDLIPDKSDYRLKVFAEDVYRALKQVQDVARQGSKIARFNWREATLNVVSASEDQTVEAECYVTVESGGDGYIAFNVDYLIEYFKGRQGLVQMCFTEPTRPGLFLDGRFYAVIMPMHVSSPPTAADQSEPAEVGSNPEKPQEEGQVSKPESHKKKKTQRTKKRK